MVVVTVKIWAMLSNPKVQAAEFHAAAIQLFEVRLAQTRKNRRNAIRIH